MKRLILIIGLLIPFVLSAQKLTYKTSEVQHILDTARIVQKAVADTARFETQDVTSNVLIVVSDTTVTPALGRIVYKTSDNHFYGCVSTTATSTPKWKKLDN